MVVRSLLHPAYRSPKPGRSSSGVRGGVYVAFLRGRCDGHRDWRSCSWGLGICGEGSSPLIHIRPFPRVIYHHHATPPEEWYVQLGNGYSLLFVWTGPQAWRLRTFGVMLELSGLTDVCTSLTPADRAQQITGAEDIKAARNCSFLAFQDTLCI